jgi:hypothetical protein
MSSVDDLYMTIPLPVTKLIRSVLLPLLERPNFPRIQVLEDSREFRSLGWKKEKRFS